MNTTFRNSAGFGKRIEFWIAGLMLKEGIDIYMPLIDDNGIDAVIRRDDGSFIEIQIKARSKNVVPGDAALFAAITHELRENYYFIFYSERMNKFWLMSSKEFIDESNQNKKGKNVGKRSIWFNGKKKIKGKDKQFTEHTHERFEKYLIDDFSKLRSPLAQEKGEE